MNQPRILVGGMGNIFLGDDAFGVAVVHLLARRSWPENVKIIDFGVRSLDLSYALMESYELVILIDALQRGHAPGTLYLLEPDLQAASEQAGPAMDPHGMVPVKALEFARRMGSGTKVLRIIGCEPGRLEEACEVMDLSPPVRSAVPKAVQLVEQIIQETLSPEDAHA